MSLNILKNKSFIYIFAILLSLSASINFASENFANKNFPKENFTTIPLDKEKYIINKEINKKSWLSSLQLPSIGKMKKMTNMMLAGFFLSNNRVNGQNSEAILNNEEFNLNNNGISNSLNEKISHSEALIFHYCPQLNPPFYLQYYEETICISDDNYSLTGNISIDQELKDKTKIKGNINIKENLREYSKKIIKENIDPIEKMEYSLEFCRDIILQNIKLKKMNEGSLLKIRHYVPKFCREKITDISEDYSVVENSWEIKDYPEKFETNNDYLSSKTNQEILENINIKQDMESHREIIWEKVDQPFKKENNLEEIYINNPKVDWREYISQEEKNHPYIIANIHIISNLEAQIKNMHEDNFLCYLQHYLNRSFIENTISSEEISKTYDELSMWYKALKFVFHNGYQQNYIAEKSLLNRKYEVNELYNKHHKIIDDMIMKLYGQSYGQLYMDKNHCAPINYPQKNPPQIIKNIHGIDNIET